MKKSRWQRREVSLLENGQEAILANLPQHKSIANESARKRARAVISLSSLVGAAISTACIICISSVAVSAHDDANRHYVGKKKFINNRRIIDRGLSGAWNWNEEDLPLDAVTSKSYKESSNLIDSASKTDKSKSNKNPSESEWSSSNLSPRWSSPRKPSTQPTPWKAGHLPTTARPTPASKPTSVIPTKPTMSPMSPTPQSPTSKPADGDPTNSPTLKASMVPTTNPSSIPSLIPSSMPSWEPTSYPSSMPSFYPSSEPTSMPSSVPSESPSSSPTSSSNPTPKYMPSASPTESSRPTSSPSATPSSSPSVDPSSSPSSSPTIAAVETASPTVSSNPTTSQRTRRPTWAPTISQEPSWAQRTKRPTFSPTISSEPTNADRTKRPTLSPETEAPTGSPMIMPETDSPTSTLITDSRSGLRMGMYGLTLLDESQVALFQERTALYMEEFYNATDSTNLLDLIKRQVTDLTVVITVDQQDPPDLLGDLRSRSLQVLQMNEKRKLQDDEVTEPCIGDPLTVTFDMELSYRTSEPSLVLSDRVISFPFRTVPFKKDYLNNYLQADDGGVFDELYCTSQMIFPGDTSAPTGAPTISSIMNRTSSPSVASSLNETMAPTTTARPSIAPTASLSSKPTLSKMPATIEPTLNATLAPTTSNAPTISSNTTLSPTILTTSAVPSSLPSTVTQEPPAKTDLRMNMFGLTRELEPLGVLLYNERTASYIESFYNDYNSTDGIRGQVLDVTATIDVTGQFVPEEVPLIEDEFRLTRQPRHGHDKDSVVNESDEDESYLPAYAIEDSDEFINARYRFDGDDMGVKKQKGTRALQIESCTGDRIELVFTASLTYRLTNSSFVEQDIIEEPFSTVLRRRIYMEEYLKGLDAGPFVDLTCTGDVIFPSDGLPTASPITVTIVPTLDFEKPSQQPSLSVTSNETSAPTVPGTSNETAVPTLERPSQQPSLSVSSNVTSTPTVPGTSNETSAPTLPGTSNETSAPTLPGTSNETSAPTMPGSFITEVKSNVGQDLFGILNLDPISADVYNIQTAAYISAFYVEDPFVTISSALVSITDEDIPVGPIEGSCSEIDPLAVSFTIEMTYSTTNPVTTFDEIIKLPFSTASFQDRFINDYLKANDVSGGFSTLQCVSGLMIPEPIVTTSPTVTFVPSSLPTVFEDDLLNDILRSGTSPERSCLDRVDQQLIDSSEEMEISFVYGVESRTADFFFVDELEGLILDFLEVSILMCLEGGMQAALQVWKIDNEQDTAGVMRVRYPELGEASTMTKCDPTLAHAKGCAVLSTKLLVTSVGVPADKVHRDILMLLNDAFKEGAFVKIIPELILTAYVGPDPEEYQLQAQTAMSPTSSQEGERQSSRVVALSFCVTVILIAGIVSWFAFPMVRQELVKGAVTCCTRRRQPECVEENALIVSQGDRESGLHQQR